MTSKLIRHTPVALEAKLFGESGAAVVCRAGGFATHRIHWEAPAAQAQRDEASEPLVTGRAYQPPNKKFTKFWISCERLAVAKEDIVLEILDCATPVIVVNERPSGYEYHPVISEEPHTEGITEGNGSSILYRDNPLILATGESAADTNRRLNSTHGWISGFASAESRFLIRMFGRATSTATANKCLLAEFYADTTQTWLDNRYSCTFLNGGRSPTSSVVDDTIGKGLLLWPVWGLEIIAYRIDADITDLRWSLQEVTFR